MSYPQSPYEDEIIAIRAAMLELIKPEFVDDWMEYPNTNWGKSPIEVIEEGHADWIWDMISRMQHGVFS